MMYVEKGDVAALDAHAKWFIREGIGLYYEDGDFSQIKQVAREIDIYTGQEDVWHHEGYFDLYSAERNGVAVHVMSSVRMPCDEFIYEYWSLRFSSRRGRDWYSSYFVITKAMDIDQSRHIVWESKIFQEEVVLPDGCVVRFPVSYPWAVFYLHPWYYSQSFVGTRLGAISEEEGFGMVGLKVPGPWTPSIF